MGAHQNVQVITAVCFLVTLQIKKHAKKIIESCLESLPEHTVDCSESELQFPGTPLLFKTFAII